MKSIILGCIVFCVVLSSCSSHFYKINGKEVILYLEKPQAKDVLLFCSLDGYQGNKLKQQNGLWEMTLPAEYSFSYFYRVDGKNFLPSCLMKEKDDFGLENCIFEPKL